MPWTVEQVMALAPDASSAKSGKDLSAARKWQVLGCDDACAWGSVQGSGKDPYQACIDLSGPAFKCTCPSRKFPCKHGLGLFLILAQQPAALTQKERPAWVSEWLSKRVEKEEKKAAKAAAPAAPPDPEAEAKAQAAAEKRAANREARVSAGLEEFRVWLDDLVRAGYASLPGKPSGFWQTPAARLVDAQAPGLARRVQALDGITATGENWPARLLAQTSLMHLACEAWSRMAGLPPATQADLRSVLGFTSAQEEVLTQATQRDRWLVLGLVVEEEERLRVQRTWLWGTQTNQAALCLSFSAGPNQPFDVSLAPGTVADADLAFFPGAWPQRALVKQRHGAVEIAAAGLPWATIAEASSYAARAWTANPWLERVPLGLSAVTPLRRATAWLVRDAVGDCLPLKITEAQGWNLASLSGGRPLALSGEWDGEQLVPMGVWVEGRFLRA